MLIVVLVVIAMLALAAYSFADLMFSQRKGALVHGRLVQARTMADSGLEAAKAFLIRPAETQQQDGGHYDNPPLFQGVLVVDGDLDQRRGRFSIVAPRVEDGQLAGVRFGLEDESTRLNLNSLLIADVSVDGGGRQLLMGLPGMTEQIADAILDWLDEDDEPREFGAELDYYSSLDPPYAPKNGPLASVEEVLLIRGISPWLLFGPDGNRNGVLDDHERANAGMFNGEIEGEMDRGWSAYLTLYSMEANLRPDGLPRINLNSNDMQQLSEDLSTLFPPAWVTYIVAYRINGPYRGNRPAETGSSGPLDVTREGRFPLSQVLDLVGGRVQVQYEGDEERTVLASPFIDGPLAYGTYLPKLMDAVTVNASPMIPGRININQAPYPILRGIPGMSEEVVDEILANRTLDPSDEDPAQRHETWILSRGIVTLDEMKDLMPYITAGGDVFRAQVVGYFDSAGPAARIETIIDATTPAPRILFWRDISHLGRGFPLEVLGTEVRE